MSPSETAEQEGHGVGSGEGATVPTIGKLQALSGPVTITRTGVLVGKPAVGDLVYEGDVIETGNGGLVGIAFADGTAFHLDANGRVELGDGNCGVKKSSGSLLLRVAKGLFGFIAGPLATSGRVFIDTPFGRVRNARSAAGFGSVALGVFTFALVRELKADSADIAFIDNGTIDYKDLKHGVFEIVTKGDHPQVIIVDDPTQTIILKPHGSGVSVEQVATTPAEMAKLESAYQGAYSAYSQGLQDPFFQQAQHANAQPQSTGAGGSSSVFYQFQNNNGPPPAPLTPNTGGNLGSHGGSGGSGSSGPSGGSGGGVRLPTPTASWNGEGGNDSWGNPANWTDSYAPLYWQDLTIDGSFLVTIDSGDEDSGPSATEVADLTMGVGATLEILDGGSLLVLDTLDVFGTVEVNDAGATLTLQGAVIVETHGTIEAINVGASIFFSDTTPPSPGMYTVDNFGTIAAYQSGEIWFEQATTKNESGGQILAQTGAVVTFQQGSFDNAGSVTIDNATLLIEQVTVTNESGAHIVAQDSGTITFNLGTSIDNSGTILANDGSISFGAGTLINEVNALIKAENNGAVNHRYRQYGHQHRHLRGGDRRDIYDRRQCRQYRWSDVGDLPGRRRRHDDAERGEHHR